MGDFRVLFASLPDDAVITGDELAQLLQTTPGSISQMKYLGKLPRTPSDLGRRLCWLAGDIRAWLRAQAQYKNETQQCFSPKTLTPEDANAATKASSSASVKKAGRPRLSADRLKG